MTYNAPWAEHALCRQVDPELFFPEERGPTRESRKTKQLCLSCDVVTPCLQWALNNNEHGIWGSTNDSERRTIRRNRTTATEYLKNKKEPA